MILFRRKQKAVLQKAVYKECMEPVGNPGRGWYRIYTFEAGKSREKPVFSDAQREEERLALMLFDIGAFADRELPDDAVRTFTGILKQFEAEGMDVILRVVYDREGKGMEKEPSCISIVQAHMKALGQAVKEAGSAVFLFQGLFVGSWGEMHGSKFLSKEHLKRLYGSWEEATGGTVKTAFRRPQQIRLVFPKIPEECRIGFFDDAMFGSPNHLGTFGGLGCANAQWEEAWDIDRELVFLEQIACAVPCGGEAVLESGAEFCEDEAGFGSGGKSCEDRAVFRSGRPCRGGVQDDGAKTAEQTVQQLQRMHVSYLNCVHDPRILQRWKTTAYCGWKSLYEYIGAHLGYRFVLRDVSLNEKDMRLCMCVRNTGFAAICDEVGAELTAEENRQEERIAVTGNLKGLGSGQQTNLTALLGGEKGQVCRYWLRLWRVRDGKVIRLANEGAEDLFYIGSVTVQG